MHRTFKKLLPRATGQSEWVVAINADIRGFSGHMAGDPAVTALYLRRVYGAILKRYYKGASFFKPTGDGLLVVVPFPEGRRRTEIAERLVNDSLRLVEEFATIADDDPLLPRNLPERLGIGLSVGSTSRIAAGGVTLDYTGPALNIATRLMDLARPSGVVVDASLLPDPLPEATASRFSTDAVFLKGVAEAAALGIRYTADLTSIPEQYRRPLVALKTVEEKETVTVLTIRDRAPLWRKTMRAHPADRRGIKVTVVYPDYKDGRRQRGDFVMYYDYSDNVTYTLEGTKSVLSFNYDPLVARLKRLGVPRTKTVEVIVRYMTDPNDSIT